MPAPAPHRTANPSLEGPLRFAAAHGKLGCSSPSSEIAMGFVLPQTAATRAAKPKSDDAVTLRGVRVPLTSDVGSAFVADCARNRERIFSDQQIQEKYDIPETDWTEITKNKPLR